MPADSGPRPGFGLRHAGLTALLAVSTPAGTRETVWAEGTMPLLVTAYPAPARLPGVLVTSVRCIVWVGDRLVLCENKDGRHPWPGGRREPGERFRQTAVREVHEETGWHLDAGSVAPLGWLHLHNLTPQPADHPYPHPDFLQLVLTGRARQRDGGADHDWTDTEGYEVRSRLVTLAQAKEQTSSNLPEWPFLDLFEPDGRRTGAA